MARLNLTMDQVVDSTGLNERTVKELLRGRNKPHPRTLHRLAAGLGVSADEFFWPCPEPGGSSPEFTNREIRKKVDQLLSSDQRKLLIELVEILSRCSTESMAPECSAKPQKCQSCASAAGVG
jgi:transcriptional regulator with XRE-family HTH domain